MYETLKVVKEIIEVVGFPMTLVISLYGLIQIILTRREAQARERLENEEVTVGLRCSDGRELVLPYRSRRKHLTRGEVAGIVGMFAGGGRKFVLPGLAQVFLDGTFDAILSGRGNVLWIEEASVEEFEAFSKEVEKALTALARKGQLTPVELPAAPAASA